MLFGYHLTQNRQSTIRGQQEEDEKQQCDEDNPDSDYCPFRTERISLWPEATYKYLNLSKPYITRRLTSIPSTEDSVQD